MSAHRSVLTALAFASALSLAATGIAAEDAALAPRRVELPRAGAPDVTHPVDLLLQSHFSAHPLPSAALVDDRTFARRVYLDLLGVLPTPEELTALPPLDTQADVEAFVADVLSDKRRYAEHWLSFWNDCLRNDYKGTGFIDGGREQITAWLYGALYENLPYDEFVRELINPSEASRGFIKGIVWRGVVNASQRPEVQAAQNIGQVFLGVNLKCASCHDSFTSNWKLTEAYGLAAVFADSPLEIHKCDRPTGEFAQAAFIYPELGAIDGGAPRAERLRQLAEALTSRANGRLTRTIVNRLWARLLGRGLIEPVDAMDNPPWSADVLDWLAEDLAEHGFDLKHLLWRIATSRAYRLPAAPFPAPDETDFVFAGPVVKRMTAEQFVDAAAALTFNPHVQALAPLPQSAQPDLAAPARWIWSHAEAAAADPGGRIFVRRTLELSAEPAAATCVVSCDNEYALYVNGQLVGTSAQWDQPQAWPLRGRLFAGRNVIAIEAINYPDPATGKGLEFAGANPGGLFFAAYIRRDAADTDDAAPTDPAGVWDVGSDAQWLWSATAADGWQQLDYDPTGWQHAVEIAPDGGPWNLQASLAAALARGVSGAAGVRAALVAADPLMVALGRPNREQVVTQRASAATTLQALELTNGATLDGMLRAAAPRWIERTAADGAQLAREVYLQGLGRGPTAAELDAAVELIGTPPQAQGVEDFLWIVLMLPEFQLIY